MNLRTRLALSFSLLGFVLVAALMSVSFLYLRQQLRTDLRQRLMDEVAIAALQVDGDLHASLTDPSQEGSPAYLAIKTVLQGVRDRATDVDYLYTLQRDPSGRIVFMVDAEEDPEDISHIGDPFPEDELLSANIDTLSEPLVDEVFTTDRWGTWLTGYAPFYDSNGQRVGILGMDISAEAILATERQALLRLVGLFLIFLVVVGLAGWVMGDRLARPIAALTQAAVKISEGNLSHRPEIRTTGTETALLKKAFYSTADQLQNLIDSLGRQVSERTRQLKATIEVGQVATAILDPEALITQVVNLITDRFGHYYAAVFLTDPAGQWAVLKDATGAAGKTLMERNHRLAVDGKSMVGTAISTRTARIALDVGVEPIRFNNPLLPDTRSEIALPMNVGDHVIGALDVQSTQEEAFNEQDIDTLQGMANQVAIALENARLFQETQNSLEELRAAHRMYISGSWKGRSGEQAGYEYKAGGLLADAQRADSSVEVPLTLREQKIGSLVLEGPHEWTAEEKGMIEAVATQAALALENARLLEESQQIALRERLVAEVTRKIWASPNADFILQTAIREIGRVLHADEATIELKVDEDQP